MPPSSYRLYLICRDLVALLPRSPFPFSPIAARLTASPLPPPSHHPTSPQALRGAITHSSEAIRIDCLELVCVNPKFSEPPGKLELEVGAATARI